MVPALIIQLHELHQPPSAFLHSSEVVHAIHSQRMLTLRAGILLMCSQGGFKYVVAIVGTSAAIISPLFIQIGH